MALLFAQLLHLSGVEGLRPALAGFFEKQGNAAFLGELPRFPVQDFPFEARERLRAERFHLGDQRRSFAFLRLECVTMRNGDRFDLDGQRGSFALLHVEGSVVVMESAGKAGQFGLQSPFQIL